MLKTKKKAEQNQSFTLQNCALFNDSTWICNKNENNAENNGGVECLEWFFLENVNDGLSKLDFPVSINRKYWYS